MSAKKARRNNFERLDSEKRSRKGWGDRRRSFERHMPDIEEMEIEEAEFFERFNEQDNVGANDQPD